MRPGPTSTTRSPGFDAGERHDLGRMPVGVAIGVVLRAVLVGDGSGDVVGNFGGGQRRHVSGERNDGERRKCAWSPLPVSGRTLLRAFRTPKRRFAHGRVMSEVVARSHFCDPGMSCTAST